MSNTMISKGITAQNLLRKIGSGQIKPKATDLEP